MPVKRARGSDSEAHSALEKRKRIEQRTTALSDNLSSQEIEIINRLELDFGFNKWLNGSSPAMPHLKLVQANIQSSNARLKAALTMGKGKPDVVAIQEPTRIDASEDWEVFAAEDHPRCATYVATGRGCILLEATSTHVTVKIEGLVITNIYNPENSTVFQKISIQEGQYVVGDFNIHSLRWCKSGDRSIGRRRFEEWIDVNGLQVLTPPCLVTHFNRKGLLEGSTIDLLLGPADGATPLETSGDRDHIAILWDIKQPQTLYEVTFDTGIFLSTLAELPVSKTKRIGRLCSCLTQMVRTAMKQSGVKTPKKTLPIQPEKFDQTVLPLTASRASVDQFVLYLQGEPGPDGIPASAVKLAWRNTRWRNAYLKLINFCLDEGCYPWRRGATVIGETSSLLGKVVESLVRNRLMMCLDGRLSDWQFAARLGYNATDAALCVDNHLRKHDSIMAMKADFEKVSRGDLRHSMKIMDVPEAIIKWTMSFMGNRTKGIPRDSPVSEALFSIYLDPLLKEISAMAYADQIVLFNKDTTLCADYDRSQDWALSKNVTLWNKQLLKKGNYADAELCGVPFRKNAKVFGVYFDSRLTYAHHVEEKGREFLCTVYQCHRAAHSIGEALELYKTRCRPIIKADSMVWYPYITDYIEKDLAHMDYLALTKLMRITIPVPAAFIYKESNVASIEYSLYLNDRAYRLRRWCSMAPQNPVHINVFLGSKAEEPDEIVPEQFFPKNNLETNYLRQTQPLGTLLGGTGPGVTKLLFIRALFAILGGSLGSCNMGNCRCGSKQTLVHVLLECELFRSQRGAAELNGTWPQILFRDPSAVDSIFR